MHSQLPRFLVYFYFTFKTCANWQLTSFQKHQLMESINDVERCLVVSFHDQSNLSVTVNYPTSKQHIHASCDPLYWTRSLCWYHVPRTNCIVRQMLVLTVTNKSHANDLTFQWLMAFYNYILLTTTDNRFGLIVILQLLLKGFKEHVLD